MSAARPPAKRVAAAAWRRREGGHQPYAGDEAVDGVFCGRVGGALLFGVRVCNGAYILILWRGVRVKTVLNLFTGGSRAFGT